MAGGGGAGGGGAPAGGVGGYGTGMGNPSMGGGGMGSPANGGPSGSMNDGYGGNRGNGADRDFQSQPMQQPAQQPTQNSYGMGQDFGSNNGQFFQPVYRGQYQNYGNPYTSNNVSNYGTGYQQGFQQPSPYNPFSGGGYGGGYGGGFGGYGGGLAGILQSLGFGGMQQPQQSQGGFDPRAIAANPQGFSSFLQGAANQENAQPGSTMFGGMGRGFGGMQQPQQQQGYGGMGGMYQPDAGYGGGSNLIAPAAQGLGNQPSFGGPRLPEFSLIENTNHPENAFNAKNHFVEGGIASLMGKE